MKNTDLIVDIDKLTNPNKVAQTLVLKNDYFKILIKYRGDYNEALASGTVTRSKLRINSLPIDASLEHLYPTISGSVEGLLISTKPVTLISDRFFDSYYEILEATRITCDKVTQYINNKFPS